MKFISKNYEEEIVKKVCFSKENLLYFLLIEWGNSKVKKGIIGDWTGEFGFKRPE